MFFPPAIAYLYIFGSGLIAGSLIRNFIEGGKFPSKFSKYYQMDVFNNHITFIWILYHSFHYAIARQQQFLNISKLAIWDAFPAASNLFW